MKKLVNPLPTGGVPIENEDILFLANESFDSIKQVLYGVGDAYVVSGCKVTNQDTLNRICTISSGYVWLNDAIQFVESYSGTYPFYIKSAPVTFTKKQLQIGALANIYADYSATVVTAKPALTPFITFNPNADLVFNNLINADLKLALDNEINTRQLQITNEITTRQQEITRLNNALSALSDKVNTKVTAKIGATDWVDIDLQSGFRQVATSGFPRAQYKRTEDGFVHLRGAVELTNTQGGILANLPSGFQTLNEFRAFIWSASGLYKIQFITVVGTTYASPIAVGSSPDRIFFLDNIRFYADGPGGVI